MTETVLLDINPILLERVRRIAATREWGLQHTLLYLLEQGIYSCERGKSGRFDDSDADALQAAIAALEGIPSSPGFSLIGKVEAPAQVVPEKLPGYDGPEFPDFPEIPKG
ncbi:hypothetical protein [Montanilutibacter psychrotolerans]|uniref:Uncharacterized protein n=1 Tax=Montanilutibacter psychrotolerans TaxID=1327343 RepID=A0A3M8SRC5_9GAMM|nr:hypothetical protein [Lysobacter psychrotolerans]RNF83891.1 hypothetical protein EER27_11100 [Lysobacter psychrotolerans]